MKFRVYEVAKQLNLDPKEAVKLLQSIGATEVRNHMSSVDAETVQRLKMTLRPATHEGVVKQAPLQPAVQAPSTSSARPANVAGGIVPPPASSAPSAADDARLFVAGLADTIDEVACKAIFEATGGTVLDVALPTDRITGRRRGFGFITMSSANAASTALQMLDGSTHAGREISVRPFLQDASRKPAPGAPPQRTEAPPVSATKGGTEKTTVRVADALTRAVTEVRKLERDAQLRSAMGLARISLQYCAFSVMEWVIEYGGEAARSLPLEDLRAPTDGTLVDLLTSGLVCAENAGWAGVIGRFFKPQQTVATAHFVGKAASLQQVLSGFVSARNDGLEGHGIAGGEDPDALLALVETLVSVLASVLPTSPDGSVLSLAAPDGRAVRISYLRLVDGDLVCFRKSKSVRTGICRVTAQRRTGALEKTDVTWDSDDKLQRLAPAAPASYDITVTPGWSLYTYIPERLTTAFMGRDAELALLWEWFNDTDSKACIVYGDGGMGKTTLVVEFIHRVLSGALGDAAWKPQMISYYSAKETRWGLDGLERIRFSKGGLSDAPTEIMRHIESRRSLDADWYKLELPQLAQRLGGYLRDSWHVQPSQHLLILDNTETLASEESEIALLATHIKELSRRVGRVLVTSRRREKMEAAPIELEALSATSAAELLRRRARDLSVDKLSMATASQLKKFAEGLEGRPLLLEVFVQTLAENGLSPERAFANVRQMQTRDLGEFLYADAWARFSEPLRHLLLLMVQVADTHDETLLRLCAAEAEVLLPSAEQALEESHGIARIQRIAGKLHVTFRKGFLEFCRQRRVVIDGVTLPAQLAVRRVLARYRDYMLMRDREIADRMGKAFRTPFAKMAWRAFQDGRYDECQAHYQLAVAEDPSNGLLFDRYALFLLRMQQDPASALVKSERAVALEPDSPEVWFTNGMIHGVLKDPDRAGVSLERARALGKEAHLVWLQVAYACLRATQPREALAREALRTSRTLAPAFVEDGTPTAAHWRELLRMERRLGMTLSQ